MDTNTEISATIVPETERLNFLPTYLPGVFMLYENTVYSLASNFCTDYKGGLWEFVTLSNGGVFIYPKSDEPFKVQCWGNHYDGTLSPEAFGIGLSLHALSHMSCARTTNKTLPERFNQLYEFAALHIEASEIFAFID